MIVPIELTVNGRGVSAVIEPRQHLADFLREHLNLTATHLRCEQGACGACTLLIDGQPARSCITFAILCDGADITTLEGLENDPAMVALRRAFSREHGLQCGYCTPGMLMTARDIVLRLPAADDARIREEISGNLCRCTGYGGIVRAIARVLDEKREGKIVDATRRQAPLGPVGARQAVPAAEPDRVQAGTGTGAAQTVLASAETTLGLAGRQPNVEIQQGFIVAQPPEAVWAFFADLARVATCLPGASLTQPPSGDQVEGKIFVKLGPITANFSGQARVKRDDVDRRGTIVGSGKDQLGGSRAAGEVQFELTPEKGGATRISLTIRALLAGPLAQFGRSGIVEDLVARITDSFAKNVEGQLSGSTARESTAPLQAAVLFRQVFLVRVKMLFATLFRMSS